MSQRNLNDRDSFKILDKSSVNLSKIFVKSATSTFLVMKKQLTFTVSLDLQIQIDIKIPSIINAP